MKKLFVLLLVLGLLMHAAVAEVLTTGDVNLRTGPGLGYEAVGSVKSGTEMEYLEEIFTDERGVDWYKVAFKGAEVWVSSKYSELTAEDADSTLAGSPDRVPAIYDPNAERVEIAAYYMAPLEEAAKELGLVDYREVSSEVPHQYFNDGLVLAGGGSVEHIGLTGAGYSVYGVAPGMDVETAKALLTEAGLDFYRDYGDTIVFEHRSEGNSRFVNEEGHDSCINLEYRNGMIVQLDWSSYTG